MRIVAELVSDEYTNRLNLLLWDRHRRPIETHQAGDTHCRQYVELLLERKVAKEIAPKQR